MTQSNNPNDPKKFAELAEAFDNTAFAQFLRDLSPILQANGRLIELGLSAVERDAKSQVTMLSPKQFAEDMGVSVRTLSNWKKKWPWFKTSHGRRNGQKYPSTLKCRVIEELRVEEEEANE